MAMEPFAPPMSFFKRGRHFTAFLGLDSRQHSTAGKQILERLSHRHRLGDVWPCSNRVPRKLV
jgi:hypothetical protein